MTNTLRNEFDERMYVAIDERRHYLGTADELTLAHYVAEVRRMGWTWDLVADALRKSPSVAKRLHRAHITWAQGGAA